MDTQQPDDDRLIYAHTETVRWAAFEDEPVRDAIGRGMVQSLREHVIMLDGDVDWSTVDGPREVGRNWRHDTGEVFEDGSPVYAFLPTPPDEDPDAAPSLVLLRVEVTGRRKAPDDGTLSV